MTSILDISVSCFPDYRSTEGKLVNLLAWLTSNKYADKVLAIRNTSDKTQRDKLKSALPAITPSGLFSKRDATGLITHTGMMQIDIDHVKDLPGTKRKITSISNVAYCGLSVSGKGLWALIPIAHPEHHKAYFTLIEKALSGMGIAIDPACKDVCRLRGYSYDPDAYFNHNAEPLKLYYTQPKINRQKQHFNRPTGDIETQRIECCINELNARKIDLTSQYNDWYALGCSFASLGENGRQYYHAVSQNYPGYDPHETDEQFNKCLKSTRGDLSTFFGMCRDAGTFFKDAEPAETFQPNAVIHVASMAGITIGEGITPQTQRKAKKKPLQTTKRNTVDYIPYEKVSKNLSCYKDNNLFTFFQAKFGEAVASDVFKKYGIGSCKYYGEGTTCFIQKDIHGNIRQVKVIPYNELTGKRLKDENKKPKIIGRELTGYDKNLTQCFFGEHLLHENDLPVAIVESGKTAAICSIVYPNYAWIATGGTTGCNMTNPDVNHVLKGRVIHLFPDVDAVKDWRKYEAELKQQGFNVFLNDVMAKHADAGSKDDIADLILKNEIILSENIYHVQWINETGSKFENMKIVWIKTNQGDYEILYDKDGLQILEHSAMIERLEKFYNKKFESGLMDGEPCFLMKVDENGRHFAPA